MRLVKLKFKACYVNENDVEVPKYINFVCSKCHVSGSLKDIQKEYKIQPNLMKREIDHDFFNISNYKVYENFWKACLINDVLGLAYVVGKHGNHIQKVTGVSLKKQFSRQFSGKAFFG